jgi:hypothetical protein
VIQGSRVIGALNEAPFGRVTRSGQGSNRYCRALYPIARQGEARSRWTVRSVGVGPAERKRGWLIVITSRAVIAAKERRSHPIDRVEDAVVIAAIRRNPVYCSARRRRRSRRGRGFATAGAGGAHDSAKRQCDSGLAADKSRARCQDPRQQKSGSRDLQMRRAREARRVCCHTRYCGYSCGEACR